MAGKSKINSSVRENVLRNPQKLQFCAMIELKKPFKEDDGMMIFIRSQMHPVFEYGLAFEDCFEMINKMWTLFTFTASSGGFIINDVKRLEIRFVKFHPIR